MAKDKDDDLDLDFNDDGMGLDDFDFNFDNEDKPKEKDTRDPISRLRDSAKEGFAETVFNEGVIAKALKDALPREMRDTFNTADAAVGEIKDQYYRVEEALKPTIKEFKKSAKNFRRVMGNALPKKVADFIDKHMNDDDDRYRSQSDQELAESKIENTLLNIFKQQQEQDGERQQEQQILNLQEAKRQTKQLDVSGQILHRLTRLTDYQDNIGINWQKEMLRLSMRQYNVQASIYKHQVEFSDKLTKMMQAVVHNTALPDLAKQTNKEVMKDVGLRRLFTTMGTRLGDKLGGITSIKNLGKHLGDKAIDTIVNPIEQIASALTQYMDMQGQMMEMEDSFAELNGGGLQQDRSQQTQSMIGKELGKSGAGWIHRKAFEFLTKQGMRNKYVKGLNGILGGGNKRLGLILNDFYHNGVNFRNKDGDETLLSKMLNGVRDIADLDMLAQADRGGSVSWHNTKDLYKPTEFNNFTQKSITEIIPGYLARILQSSEGIRTGKLPGLVVYSHGRDKFITEQQNSRDVLSRITGDGRDGRYYRESIDNLIEKFETDDVKFSQDERIQLRNAISNAARRGENLQLGSLVRDDSEFSNSLSQELREKLLKGLKGKVNLDENGNVKLDDHKGIEYKNEFEYQYRRVIGDIPDYVNKIKDLTREGVISTDSLKAYGILQSDGWDSHSINMQRLYEMTFDGTIDDLLDPKKNPPNFDPAQPQSGGMKSGAIYQHQQKRGKGRGKKIFVASDNLDSGHGYSAYSRANDALVSAMSSHGDLLKQIASNTHVLRTLSEAGQVSPDSTGEGVSWQTLNESIHHQTAILVSVLSKMNQNTVDIGVGSGAIPDPKGRTISPDEMTSGIVNWRKLGRLGKDGLSFAKNQVSKANRFFRNSVKRTYEFGRDKIVSPIVNRLKEGSLDFLKVDLYLPENMKEPIVKARDMAMGLYCDAKGNTIKSFKQLKGHLYKRDEEGNLVIIATAEELQNKVVDATGKRFNIKRLMGFGRRAGAWMSDAVNSAIGFLDPSERVRSAKQFIANQAEFLKERMVNDVYVGDDENARITAMQLMKGVYFCNGKPLTRVKDILADVTDKDGNIILSLEEVRQRGLYNKDGKPYKDVSDKLIYNLITNPANITRKLVKGGWDLFSNIGSGMRSFLGKVFSNWDASISLNSKWTKRIYELLVWRFGGQPDHHKQNVTNDSVTDTKKNADGMKEGFTSTMDKASRYAKHAKRFAGKRTGRFFDFIDENARKASEYAKSKSVSDIGNEVLDSRNKILDYLRGKMSPEQYAKIKEANSGWTSTISRYTGLGNDWIDVDDLPDKLLTMFISHHWSHYDKLVSKIDGKEKINLKKLLKLERERLTTLARNKGYPIGDERNEYSSRKEKMLNWIRGKTEKSDSKKQAREEARQKREEARSQRSKKFGWGILDKFGNRRKGSWMDRILKYGNKDRDTGEKFFGKKTKKKGGLITGTFSLLGKFLPAIWLALKQVPLMMGKIITAPFKMIASLLSGIGKGLKGAFDFGKGLITGKGSGVLGKAGAITGKVIKGVGRGVMHVAGRALMAGLPAGLAVIGIAAIGYGAYKLWKWARDNFQEMDEYRLAGYGLQANNDVAKSNMMLAFEKEFEKDHPVNPSTGRVAENSSQDMKKWAAFFWNETADGQLSQQQMDEEQLPRFTMWFNERFYPVYKRHKEALYAVTQQAKHDGLTRLKNWLLNDDGKGLYDLESIADGYKPSFVRLSFLDKDKSPNTPNIYSYTDLPFSDQDKGSVNHEQVKYYATRITDKFASAEKNVLEATRTELRSKDGKGFKFEDTYRDRDLLVAQREQYKADVEAGKIQINGKDKDEVVVAGNNDTKVKVKVGEKEIEVPYDVAIKEYGLKDNRVSNLQAMRFIAYGLLYNKTDAFVRSHMELILRLEKMVKDEHMRSEARDGSGGEMVWASGQEGYDKIWTEIAPKCGFTVDNPTDKKEWFVWFTRRFLPIYFGLLRTAYDEITDFRNNPNLDKVPVADQMPLADYLYIRDVLKIIRGIDTNGKPTGNFIFKDVPINRSETSMKVFYDNIKAEKESKPYEMPLDETKKKELKEKWAKYLQAEKDRQERVRTGTTFGRNDGGYIDQNGNFVPGNPSGSSSMNGYGASGQLNTDNMKGFTDIQGTGITLSGMQWKKPENFGPDMFKGKNAQARYEQIAGLISEVSKGVGVPEELMIAMANKESTFNPFAKSSASSASGLYQFTDSTWEQTTKQYGAQYGITSATSRFDPVANALMAAHLIKDRMKNVVAIKQSVGLDPKVTAADIYAGHFLGEGGMKRLLTAIGQNPNAPLTSAMDQKQISANSQLTNGGNMTVGQFYNVLSDAMMKKDTQQILATRGLSIGVDSGFTEKEKSYDLGTPLAKAGENASGAVNMAPGIAGSQSVLNNTSFNTYGNQGLSGVAGNIANMTSMGPAVSTNQNSQMVYNPTQYQNVNTPSMGVAGAIAGMTGLPGQVAQMANAQTGGKYKWIEVAEREIGVAEYPGSQANPRISEYHMAASAKGATEDTSWCSSFMNWVMQQCGLMGTGSAQAISWLKWVGGDIYPADKPIFGSLVVFSYGGGKGHVGIVVGRKDGKLAVLGGNQSDSVKVSGFGTGKVAGYVLPKGVPPVYDIPDYRGEMTSYKNAEDEFAATRGLGSQDNPNSTASQGETAGGTITMPGGSTSQGSVAPELNALRQQAGMTTPTSAVDNTANPAMSTSPVQSAPQSAPTGGFNMAPPVATPPSQPSVDISSGIKQALLDANANMMKTSEELLRQQVKLQGDANALLESMLGVLQEKSMAPSSSSNEESSSSKKTFTEKVSKGPVRTSVKTA